MTNGRICLALTVWICLLGTGASAQPSTGVDRLYILNCGEGIAGDISRWSGVDEGKSMPFADNCYLIHHTSGWMMWDTGIPDAVASMPDGLPSPDPKATHWYRPKTVASQLMMLGLTPADIKVLAVSHTHPDHIGNVELFPRAMLFVQKIEYDWPGAGGKPRFDPAHPVTKLEGDRDVFGDGSVTIISTPGHTPGHQSLVVKLRNTGAVVLSGDAVHFRANFDNRRVPALNTDRNQTLASMQRISDLIAADHAQLWINHDRAQRDTLKMAPEFYD